MHAAVILIINSKGKKMSIWDELDKINDIALKNESRYDRLLEIKTNACLLEQNLSDFLFDDLQYYNADRHLKNLAISNCNLVRALIDKLNDSLNEE